MSADLLNEKGTGGAVEGPIRSQWRLFGGATADGGWIGSILRRLAPRWIAGRRDPRPAMAITISRDGVQRVSPAARAALGQELRHGAPVAALVRALGPTDRPLGEAIEALIDRGIAFRRRATLGDKGTFDVVGAPVGASCVIWLTDVTAAAATIAGHEERLAAVRAEIDALTAAIDASGAPMWRLDAEGRVLHANAAARRTGAEPPERGVVRIPLPQDRGALIVQTLDAVHANANVVLSSFIDTVTDTFAHLRIGLAIFDRDRRLTLANPAVAEVFGMEPDFLTGRPTLRQTLDRLREARRLPEQLDYPAWRATLFTLFDDVARARYDERWELPDGRVIHVVGRPHPMGGIAFVFEDVTEAIAAQRWRLTAVEVRRAMLDALGDGVVAFGPDGKMRMANPALLRLWRLGDTVESAPRHVAEFADACAGLTPDVPIWNMVRDAVTGGGAGAPRTQQVRLGDGRILSARIAQMPDGSTLAAFSDVTDSQHVADALSARAATLEAAEQMRAATLYQISHGLRTPLNAVMGFAELLAQGQDGPLPEPRNTYLRNIRDASRLLLDGVESLTDLVKAGAPSVEEGAERVALNSLLRGAVELLEQRIAERELTIDITASATGAVALGDPPRLRQLVFAALSEAVTHAARATPVTVGADIDGDRLTLWFAAAWLEAGAGRSGGFALAADTAAMHGGELAVENASDTTARIVCRMAAAPEKQRDMFGA
ncbi:MAG: PAS-domain containing protein [Rubrimonas sp.]